MPQEFIWSIENLDCPHCAAALEEAVRAVPGVTMAHLDFMAMKLSVEGTGDTLQADVVSAAKRAEPDVHLHLVTDPGSDEDEEHHHAHSHEDTSLAERTVLWRAGGAAAVTLIGYLAGGPLGHVLFVLAFLLAGYDVVLGAWRSIRRGQVFNEQFLMAVAGIGALIMGDGEEAVAVMALYQAGEWFQDRAVDRSRRSIAALMNIKPDFARLVQGHGTVQVKPETVAADQVIRIHPGDRVPLDGVVLEGTSTLDTAALTGESLPRDVQPGDEITSGCVNGAGMLTMRVTRTYGDSTVARILKLVESSGRNKAPAEKFITRFARVYTPIVCGAAVLLAVVPSLMDGQWTKWIHQALTFLVISCPCALVLSVPLTFFSSIGGASRKGILIKGGNYVEALAKVEAVVFDKTGTLTQGVFKVTAIHPETVSEDKLLEVAVLAEQFSDHPISRSLKSACTRALDSGRVTNVTEISGQGIQATVDGHVVLAGNSKLMDAHEVAWHPCSHTGTIVHVAQDGVYMGHIVISDEVKPTSAQAIQSLRNLGIRQLVMLTGDVQATAKDLGGALGMTHIHAELMPEEKVEQLESLMQATGGRVAALGDGINDAPLLRRANPGIAMGAMGSDAAIEAADVVLMDDDPGKLPAAIAHARRTMDIVRQNIAMALGIKAVVLLMGFFGVASMWLAVFADVGVALLAVLNAMRASARLSDKA